MWSSAPGSILSLTAILIPGLRVFEVDHPATQAWKREQLQAAGIAIPSSLTFVPIDFEQQTLAEGLGQAGFEWTRRLFSRGWA